MKTGAGWSVRARERERPSNEPERNAVTEVERRTCISSKGRGGCQGWKRMKEVEGGRG